MSDDVIKYEGDFIKIIRTDHWEWVQRMGCTGACVIVPLTTNNELVLVEQYRYPVKAQCIEFPAGLVADIDKEETPQLSAQRELLEETGYQAIAMSNGEDLYSSAGLTDEISTVFVAYGCQRVAEGGGDETENITVHVVPVNEVYDWIHQMRGEGKAVSSNIFYGLSFIHEYL